MNPRLDFALVADGPRLRIAEDRYFVAEVSAGMNDRAKLAGRIAALCNAARGPDGDAITVKLDPQEVRFLMTALVAFSSSDDEIQHLRDGLWETLAIAMDRSQRHLREVGER